MSTELVKGDYYHVHYLVPTTSPFASFIQVSGVARYIGPIHVLKKDLSWAEQDRLPDSPYGYHAFMGADGVRFFIGQERTKYDVTPLPFTDDAHRARCLERAGFAA